MKNSVSLEQIKQLLDEAETQEYTFYGKDHIVCFKLKNGFTISGRAACVDPSNFNIDIGRKIAREDAENQLWKLEGYLLQNSLYKQGIL